MNIYQYIFPIYTTVISILCGWLWGKLKTATEEHKESYEEEQQLYKAMKDGIAILLRGQLIRYYNDYSAEKEIPTVDWIDIEQTHSVYKKLGGNHTGDRLYEELKSKKLSARKAEL